MIFLIFFFILCALTGFLFLNKIFSISDKFFLWGGSLPIGFSLYTFFLNISASFIPVQKAFLSAIIILLAIFLLLLIRKSKNVKFISNLTNKQSYILTIVVVVIGYVYTSNYFYYFAYDEGFHLPLIKTIANGNFPVKSVYFPDQYVQYHYGYDLLVAAISSLSHIPVWLSSDIILIPCIISTFTLIFSLLLSITKKFDMSITGAFLFFYGGGLNIISLINGIDWSMPLLWDYIKKITREIINENIFSAGYFHTTSIETFGAGGAYHHPTAFATPLVIILFYLFYIDHTQKLRSYHRILISILLGYLALLSEHIFVLFLVLFPLWLLIKKIIAKSNETWRSLIKECALIILPAIFIATLQGGVITDMLLHSTGHIQGSSFHLRSIPGLPGFKEFQPLNTLDGWKFFLQEWGIPLIAAPLTLYYLLRWAKMQSYYYFFILFIIFPILVPLFVQFVADADITRVSFMGYVLLGSMLGLVLIDIYNRTNLKNKSLKKIFLSTLLLLLSFSPIMFNLRILPIGIIIRNPPYSDIEYRIADDISNILPINARVFTINPDKIGTLWNVYTPAISDYPIRNFDAEYIQKKFSLTKLQADHINYLYIDPELRKIIKYSESDLLKSGWNRIYNNEYQGKTYSLYHYQ